MQHRIEDDSEADYDTHAPPYKRRKLSRDSTRQQHTETSYDNPQTYGNARAHYGHVFNYIGQAPHAQPSPIHPEASRVLQDPHGRVTDSARLIEALRFEHMNTHLASMRTACAGTCEWLLERAEYKTWRENGGFLWIKGKPGTGKSTIMKYAYNYSAKVVTDDVSLSYFFSARSTSLQCSAEGLYRSLLDQLLEKHPELSEPLEKHELHPNGTHKVWHKDGLEVLLHEAVLVLPTRHLTCYVDAIDECGYTEAQEIMEFLGRLIEARERAGLRMHVLVSSRHYPHVIFSGCQQITLEDQDEHKADISLYIRHKLQIGNSSQAWAIRNSIQERAHGVFLWVVMIVQILNEDKARGRVHLLRGHLNALPGGLHELFGNIVRDDLDKDRILQLTFQWLLFAYRPLRLEELYFALIGSELPNNVREWKQDEVSVNDMANFILDSSRGLVEIARSAGSPTVQFIHESVRDYLLNAWLPAFDVQQETNPVALCHEQLRQCCHRYIMSIVPVLLQSSNAGKKRHMPRCFRQTLNLRSRLIHSYPFLEYALDGIVSHADASQSHGVNQRECVGQFPTESWVRLHNMLVVTPADRIGEEVDCKYVFVVKNALHLTKLAFEQQSLLARGCCDLTGERHRSLLGAAVANDCHAMAELLLERCADPDSAAGGSLRCLDVAVMHGNVEMVRTLLHHNATPQRSNNDPQKTQPSALSRAAELGITEIVGILLAHPTYATQWNPDMDCVLEAAIYKSNGPMIQLLHDRMSPEKRDVVRIMHAGNDISANRFGQEDSAFEALDSFKMYYRVRDRCGPALLDTIHWLYKDHLKAPFRVTKAIPHHRAMHRRTAKALQLPSLTETSRLNPPAFSGTPRAFKRSMSARNAVATDTVVQVLRILKRCASTLRVPLQITNHAAVLEDTSGNQMVHLAPRDNWVVFFDYKTRTFHHLPGYAHFIPEGICFSDGDCGHNDISFLLSAPFAGVARPRSRITMSMRYFLIYAAHMHRLLKSRDSSKALTIKLLQHEVTCNAHVLYENELWVRPQTSLDNSWDEFCALYIAHCCH